jgi:outer membrane protein TolC
MKQFTFILTIFLTISCGNGALAQTASLEISEAYKTEVQIPPIKVIIDSVIKKNAMLRYRNQEIEAKEYAVDSERKNWTKNFGIQADTRYGTFDNLTANSIAGQTITTYSRTANTQFNYGVGLYLKIPVFDGINRKNQINIAKVILEEAKSMAENQEDEIRQLVIKQYQDIILKQKLLDLRSQNLGNAKVNMEMVEKEFRNGITSIAEYVRLSDMTSRIESEYEVAKSDFLLSKKLLEDMAGFTFGLTEQY